METALTNKALIKAYENAKADLYVLYVKAGNLLSHLDPEEEFDQLGEQAEELLEEIRSKYFPDTKKIGYF